MNTNIVERALLVVLKISAWSGRKFDGMVTKEVHDSKAAASDSGRYNKYLLAGGALHLEGINRAKTKLREMHYRETLPWLDSRGQRLLPTANHERYIQAYATLADQFESTVINLVANWDESVECARVHLGSMFQPQEYPSRGEIASKFSIGVRFFPLPATGDFRLELPGDVIEQVRRDTQEQCAEAAKIALQDAWQRLSERVEHMADKLGDPEGVFRDTLISSAAETIDALKRLNITDDPTLEAYRLEAETKLLRYSADDLRDDDSARAETARAADDILRRMRGLV